MESVFITIMEDVMVQKIYFKVNLNVKYIAQKKNRYKKNVKIYAHFPMTI